MYRLNLQQKNIVIATTAAAVILTTTICILMLRRRKKRKDTVDGVIIPSPESSTSSKEVTNMEDVNKITVNQQQQLTEIPKNWTQIGIVSGLHIYPMKSARKVNLTKADATELGLQEICRKGRLPLRDRVFLIYREDNSQFISNKTYPKLMRLTVNSLNNNSVEFSLEKDKIIVKVPEINDKRNIIMREEKIPTIDCGDEVAAWVSTVITGKNKGFRVGYWPDCTKRDVSTVYGDCMKVYKNMCNDFIGAYADVGSYLFINQSSVDDLNVKINDNRNRITPDNFRPNIIVDGADPYSEDKWTWIKVGEEAIFKAFKPCTSYRQVQNKDQKEVEGDSPVMGMYVGLHKRGRIKFGDPVYICS